MKLHITGTNTEITAATNKYIERKFNKLNKHLPDIINIKVEVSEEQTKSREQRFLIRATLSSGVGKSVFHAEERAEDLFKATDKIINVMKRQLEKYKSKLYDRGRGNPLARGKFPQAEAGNATGQVVKTKRFIIEPMTQEEAIAEMERLKHNFFLFYDADVNEVHLLYRRKDNNYGIIEPELK